MANYENIRPYADFSHEAAQRGGVDAYLNEFGKEHYDLGVLDEKSTEATKAIIVFFSAIGLWEGAKAGFRYVKEKHAQKRLSAVQKANTSRELIRSCVESSEALEYNDLDTVDNEEDI